MIEIIFIIVFLISLIGIGMILFQKIPFLLELPEDKSVEFNWKELLVKTKRVLPFKNFSLEKYFQKVLSKIRILTLKIDNKTSSYLQKLREKTKKKQVKEKKNDNYWQEVKKFKKK